MMSPIPPLPPSSSALPRHPPMSSVPHCHSAPKYLAHHPSPVKVNQGENGFALDTTLLIDLTVMFDGGQCAPFTLLGECTAKGYVILASIGPRCDNIAVSGSGQCSRGFRSVVFELTQSTDDQDSQDVPSFEHHYESDSPSPEDSDSSPLQLPAPLVQHSVVLQ